jgi:hypothetical protein
MKKITLLMTAFLALGLSSQGMASDQEARVYCQDAAKVMQLEGEKAAAYIKECVKAKLEEEAED